MLYEVITEDERRPYDEMSLRDKERYTREMEEFERMKQWNAVGRKVAKGSKAIWILAPCVKKIRDSGHDNDEPPRTIIYGS